MEMEAGDDRHRVVVRDDTTDGLQLFGKYLAVYKKMELWFSIQQTVTRL